MSDVLQETGGQQKSHHHSLALRAPTASVRCLAGARIAGEIPLPMAIVSVMAMAMMILVSIRPMILSLVMINIEKPGPAQIRIVTVMASPIPTIKIIMSTQPPGIMVAVPDNVVPVVTAISSIMTSMC